VTQRMILRTGAVGCILVVTVGYGWWRYASGGGHQDLGRVRIVKGSISRQLTVSGVLMPTRRAVVSAALSGRVKAVNVNVGTQVSKGQVIIDLDPADVNRDLSRKQLAVRRAEVSARETGLTDVVRLLRDIDLAQARLDLQAAVDRADSARLRAPINGVVVHLAVSEGDSVSAGGMVGGGAVAVVADSSSYSVELELDESEAASFRSGLDAIVYVRSEDRPLQGRVVGSPTLRRVPSNRLNGATYSGTVSVLTPPNEPSFGQSARVEVGVVDRQGIPVVPVEAVFTYAGKTYLLAVMGSSLRPVAVTIGAVDDVHAELVSGPPPGTTVATGSSEHLRQAAFGRPDEK